MANIYTGVVDKRQTRRLTIDDTSYLLAIKMRTDMKEGTSNGQESPNEVELAILPSAVKEIEVVSLMDGREWLRVRSNRGSRLRSSPSILELG